MYIAGPDGFTGKQAPSESAVGNYGPLNDADVFASGSRSPKRRKLTALKSAQGYKRIDYRFRKDKTDVAKRRIIKGGEFGSQSFAPSNSLMLKKGLARAGSQLVEGNDDEHATTLQDSQLSSK